ncbi:hypothetical protein K8R30_02455 [archaeon]|nr:hypothetical protein [archaeon]
MSPGKFKVSPSCNYDDAVSSLSSYLVDLKNEIRPRQAMVVGISGLSQSGKTRTATSLTGMVGESFFVEGDKYQPGRETGMTVYKEVLEDLRAGRPFDLNFHHRVWNYAAMMGQILEPISAFNASGEHSRSLQLKSVVNPNTKREDSMHDEEYTITRDTTILIPCMYLRHMTNYFDQMIHLDISPETSVNRKMETSLRKGVERSRKLTEEMVLRVEHPAMIHQENIYDTTSEISLDVDDFGKVFTL